MTASQTSVLATVPADDSAFEIQPEFLNGKPALLLPGPGYLLSDFSKTLGTMLCNHGIFSRGGRVFALDHEGQKLELVAPAWLRTWVEDFVSPYKLRSGPEGMRFKSVNTMPEDSAKAVLASHQFLEQLPKVERFHPCPMPWKRKDGGIELLPIGLDAESNTFTADPGFTIEPMSLADSLATLDNLLEEFAWPDDDGRSKSVAIAAMLTVFASGLMEEGANRPVFLYVANAEGSGKTTLAQLAGLPYRMTPVETAPTDEAEWQKKLLSVVMSGRRLLLLDNLKGRLNSAALEAYTTSPHYTGRILGVSSEFTGEAGASVLITGNGLTITGDLRRRCLLVELNLKEMRAEDRKFKRTLDSVAMSEQRQKVLSALWGLVKAWNEADRPACSIGNSSFPRWSESIGGIVEFAGYGCPTRTPVIEGMGDTDTSDMEQLVGKMEPRERYTFSQIEEMAIETGLFDWITSKAILANNPSIGESPTLQPGQKKQLSTVLGRYKNRRMRDGSIFCIEGHGHMRKYFLKTP